MSVQGTWELSVWRPDGTANTATTDLVVAGTAVTGTARRSDGFATSIVDGTGAFDGSVLTFDIALEAPVAPVTTTMHFALTVLGDTMDGTVNSPHLGESKVTGKRA